VDLLEALYARDRGGDLAAMRDFSHFIVDSEYCTESAWGSCWECVYRKEFGAVEGNA
jgi:hypothetical protein